MVPKILYKYFKVNYGIEVLQNLLLKVTTPEELNDPFEFLPDSKSWLFEKPRDVVIDQILTSKEAEAKQAINRLQKLGGNISKETLRTYMLSDRGFNTLVKSFKSDLPKALKGWVFVLCMAEKEDNLLMWSHYAEEHKGIVIGFDIDQNFFPKEKLLKVDYPQNETRIKIHPFLKPDTPELTEKANDLAKTKTSDWKYEQEWRIILSKGNDLQQKQLNDGKEGHFLPIPANLIKEVILGCKCEDKTEENIRQILRQNRFRNTTLKKASKHDTMFKLNINVVNVI